MNSNLHDFLRNASEKRLRKEIVNICNSYSNSWDVLAELCQNSVDAINKYLKLYGKEPKNHRIMIIINARDRSIEIIDSGVGFVAEDFIELIAPHGTDKDQDTDSIGEKGVGLTYTIFSSNHYFYFTFFSV